MTTIMFAKWVGDLFTHSIYHSILELKCIPFLDIAPVHKENGKPGSMFVYLSIYQIYDINVYDGNIPF